MSVSRLSRRHVNFALASGAALILTPGRARAADFSLKHSHNLPEESPLHKRAVEMWAAVKAQTNGRVDVQIVHTDGGLDNLVKGELAFTTLAGNGLASLLPAADVRATPYGFRNPAQV